MSAGLRGSTVAIIGLGLMGGSLARELAASGVQVLGSDTDPDTVQRAAESGVLTGILDDSMEGAAGADLLVLAVPVNRAEEALARALPHISRDCIITDLGSTKLSIERSAIRLGVAERFVGSHPLTGDHRSGWGASHRDLYAWQRVFLCPTSQTRAEALERIRSLWESVGALPEVIGAEEHDRQVAWTSHLPQVAATAMALALAGADQPRAALGPGGRDATRLASSSPAMWSAICADNAAHIEPALRELERYLNDLREAIARRSEAEIGALFARARAWAEEQRLS